MAIGDVIQSEDQRRTLVDHLTARVAQVESDREEFLQRVNKWRRQREALPEQKVKNFPWSKSSNVCVPVAAMRTDMIASAFKATFAEKKPFFGVTPHDENLRPAADALSEYLEVQTESRFHLNLRLVNNSIFYDCASLGTQFVAVPWLRDVHSFKRKDPMSGTMEEVNIVKHNGPMVVPIQLENFFTETWVTDVQKAPWIGIRHYLTLQELRQREYQGIYENVDEMADSVISKFDDNTEQATNRLGLALSNPEQVYEIFEFYVFEDVDGDGVHEDIKLWVEPKSGVVLREEFNSLGMRDVVRIPFKELPGQLYAMGVGWMCEHEQEAVDALFNMAVNSTHISSLQMVTTKRTSTLAPNEEFYPLKQLTVDEPGDIGVLTFPNTAGPNLNLIAFLRELYDRLVGANNAMTGSPDRFAGTRGTASGYMFQAQQGSRLFNAAVDNVENAYSEIGMLIFFQLIAHMDEVDFGILAPERASLVEQVIRSLSIETVHLHFAFSIRSAEIEQSEEAKRQRTLTLVQLYSLYGQKILGLVQGELALAMQAGDKQTAAMMLEKYKDFTNSLLVGSTKLMETVLEEMNMDRTGLLPYMRDLEMLQMALKAMKDQQLGEGDDRLRQGSGAIPANPAGGIGGPGEGLGGPGNAGSPAEVPQQLPGAGG
jgi:hypothetical protein